MTTNTQLRASLLLRIAELEHLVRQNIPCHCEGGKICDRCAALEHGIQEENNDQ